MTWQVCAVPDAALPPIHTLLSRLFWRILWLLGTLLTNYLPSLGLGLCCVAQAYRSVYCLWVVFSLFSGVIRN